MKNLCMAHRGWSGKAPENTMAAFYHALQDPIVSAIELDVQLSRDGIPVVIHDFTLERTTTGSGLVQETTCKDLQALDAGKWFDESFTGEKIPSLDEVLQASKGKKLLNIELKKLGLHYPGLEEKVISLIQQYKMEEQVIITSFYHPSLRIVKDLAPFLKTGPIIEGHPVLLKQQLEYLGANLLSINYAYVTKELLEDVFQSGTGVVVWTVDDPNHMVQLANLDERIYICTNFPDRWELPHDFHA